MKTSNLLKSILLFICLLAAANLFAQQQTTASAPPPNVKTFKTPDQAADALIAAADKFDKDALVQLFGEKGKDLVITVEPPDDKEIAKTFVDLAREKKSISIDPKNKNLAYLLIGKDDWPFAIPIAKKNGVWFFDSEAG